MVGLRGIDFDRFNLWLADKEIDPQHKIAVCACIIQVSKRGAWFPMEALGKASCHLAYRFLDGSHNDLTVAVDAAEWTAGVLRGAVSEDTGMLGRWLGSVLMAEAYLRIWMGDLGGAENICQNIISDEHVAAYPQNALNQLRACCLIACRALTNQEPAKADRWVKTGFRLFKLEMATIALDNKPVCVGDELQSSAGAVKVLLEVQRSILLREPIDRRRLEHYGFNGTFKTALLTICDGG